MLELVCIDQPGMYSMALSLLALEVGLRLLQQRRPDLLFLSLNDWVHHLGHGHPEVAPFGSCRSAYGHPVDAQGLPDLDRCRLNAL